MVAEEFQAVVLAAGRGSRITELTSARPKCLLPVGKMPVLYHSLKLLASAGFLDVIVVVLKSVAGQISQALAQFNLKLNVDLVEIPVDEDWGTADSLRFLVKQKKIRADVLLVTSDLFTNGDVNNLLHMFRQHRASLCAQFYLPYDGFNLTEPLPGAKSKYKPEKDIIGINSDTSHLVFLASASDFEETVPLSRSLLRKHPNVCIRSDLVDGHVYVLAKGLAEYLAGSDSFSTLKGEFFPYIVGKQHLRPLKSESESSLVSPDGMDILAEDNSLIWEWSAHTGDHTDLIRNYAVTANSNIFAVRINTLQALCQANRLCIEGDFKDGDRVDSTAKVDSSQVSPECFIGANCHILEKTSLKSSVLGESCVVRSKTRITKCIIFKKVEIQESCVVENCIIADEAVIGSGCELKNCVIGAHHFVPDNTKATNQVLTKSDGLMEI